MFTGKTPDVTPAQILAVLTWVGAQAVAYGWITDQTDKLALSITATVLAAGWKIADAIIRYGRNRRTHEQPAPAPATAAPLEQQPPPTATVEPPAAAPRGVTLAG